MSAVYFLQGEQTGTIKIGFSRWLGTRINALKKASAEPVSLLGAVAGDVQFERNLHNEFSHLRVNGEWYRSSPELIDRIKSIINSRPSPPPEIPATAASDKFTQEAAAWLKVIEEGASRRFGKRETVLRKELGERLAIHPGYIENLRRGRAKHPISARDYDAIKGEYVNELNRQIEEANAMIAWAAETQLAKARQALDGGMK